MLLETLGAKEWKMTWNLCDVLRGITEMKLLSEKNEVNIVFIDNCFQFSSC